MTAIDLTGQRFGRLLVICEDGRKNHQIAWRCQCDCGNVSVVRSHSLRTGDSKSCGCFSAELYGKRNLKHGMYLSPEYRLWAQMIQRCQNPKLAIFVNYGARGIKVCKRWMRFENFLADMGAKPTANHSIERKNNDGDYCPSNCRWATPKEQANNRRTNRILVFDGQSMNLAQWADLRGIHRATLWSRLRAGMPIHQALTKPIKT